MRCPRCGLENPPVAAFCMRCGQQLQVESKKAPAPGEQTEATPQPGAASAARSQVPQGPQKPSTPQPQQAQPAPQQPARVPKQATPAPPAQRPPAQPQTPPAQPAGPAADEEQERTAWAKMREPIPEFPAAAPIPKPQQPAPPPAPPASPDVSAQLTVPLGVVGSDSPFSPPAQRPADKIVCPNCYAVNAPGNNFCRECGNPLPKATAPLAAKPMPPSAVLPVPPVAPQTTTAMPLVGEGKPPGPPGAPGVVPGMEPLPGAAAEKTRARRQIGPADALALLALIAIVLALVPLFKWTRISGRNIWAFTYQGAASGTAGPGFPGGPGVLPYAGMEWLTMGLIGAVAGALALCFLVARVGRGPMFTLAGCLCLFPFVYHLTQSVVPLRAHGVEFTRGIGFKSLFFGISGSGYGGLGPPVWLLLGAAILLIVAGFLAPPRAITRLLTFFLFFLVVIILAAFAAVCYNFNLFIPEAIARGLSGG